MRLNRKLSVAGAETLLAGLGYITLAYCFDGYEHLLIAVLVAPFLLMRTPASTQQGVIMFLRIAQAIHKGLERFFDTRGNKLPYAIIQVPITLISLIIYCLLLVIGSIIAKITATLIALVRTPLTTLKAIPHNWHHICCVVRLHDTPELVPTLGAANLADYDVGELSFDGLVDGYREEALSLDKGITGIALLILFTPAIIYRINLKASSVFYAPLFLLINKIGPFQGILGVIGLVLGVMGILNSLSPFMLIPLIGSAVFAALGLIFALDLIKSVTGSSALDSLAAKLMPFKGLMGLVLIGLTVYGLVMYITA